MLMAHFSHSSIIQTYSGWITSVAIELFTFQAVLTVRSVSSISLDHHQ